MEQKNLFEMEDLNAEKPIEQPKVKGSHGGARAGAGRKKVYKSKFDSKRLKVSRDHYDLAKALISVIENAPVEREFFPPYACMLDGSTGTIKGSGLKKWSDFNAVCSEFSLYIMQRKDVRLFALAWVLTLPRGVELEHITRDKVALRWQRIDEITRLMACYGYLLGKSKTTTLEKKHLEKIPDNGYDIAIWLKDKEYLKY